MTDVDTDVETLEAVCLRQEWERSGSRCRNWGMRAFTQAGTCSQAWTAMNGKQGPRISTPITATTPPEAKSQKQLKYPWTDGQMDGRYVVYNTLEYRSALKRKEA